MKTAVILTVVVVTLLSLSNTAFACYEVIETGPDGSTNTRFYAFVPSDGIHRQYSYMEIRDPGIPYEDGEYYIIYAFAGGPVRFTMPESASMPVGPYSGDINQMLWLAVSPKNQRAAGYIIPMAGGKSITGIIVKDIHKEEVPDPEDPYDEIVLYPGDRYTISGKKVPWENCENW